MHFKVALINDLEQVARIKLSKLSQHSSVESQKPKRKSSSGFTKTYIVEILSLLAGRRTKFFVMSISELHRKLD